MSFLYPAFLWAFLALSVPVIIHIIQLRSYVTVYFSNVDFLSDLEKEAKSKVLLKKWLLLLIRLLALSALILAFAVPVKTEGSMHSNSKNTKYIICVDNSMSLTSNRDAVRLLDYAKSHAIELVSGLNQEADFYYLNYQNNAFALQLTKEQIINEINKTSEVAKSSLLNELLDKAQIIINQDTNTTYRLFLISDFQRTNVDFTKFKDFKNGTVHIINLEPDAMQNVAIDSVWTENPGHLYMQDEEIQVLVHNYGNQLVENLELKLSINDSIKAYTVISVNANTTKQVSMSYKNTDRGIVLGKIIMKDNGYQFDNEYFFSYLVKPKIKVKVYSKEGAEWLKKFYGDTSYFQSEYFSSFKELRKNINPVDLLVINELSEIEFDDQQYLLEHLQSGNSVLFIPSLQNELTTRYNSFLNELGASSINSFDTALKSIAYIDFENPLFKNSLEKQHNYMELPFVRKKFGYTTTAANEKALLSFMDKTAALVEVKYKGGLFYFFTFSLSAENSNFIQHPIIIPVLFNSGFLSSSTFALSYKIQNGLNIATSINFEPEFQENITMLKNNTENKFIPGVTSSYQHKLTLLLYDQLQEVGNYVLFAAQNPIYGLSFNYDKGESSTEFYSNQEISEQLALQNLSNYSISEANLEQIAENTQIRLKEKSYWYYFIVLAFVLFLSEMLLESYWARKK